MSTSTTFLQFTRTGIPQEVLELQHRELAPLGPREVRVAMRYAPINPADINFIEGVYGRPSSPPAVPGTEGSGEVVAIGSEVESLAVGDFVIPLHSGGTWSEHLTAPEFYFAKLPDNIDLVQASMLRINPVTAWRFTQDYVNLEAGEWIVQNAGNSGVGRALIQIAKQHGWRTLSFVRRAELVDELKALGGTEVLVDDDANVEVAREIMRSSPPRIAANAVGGDSAVRLMDLLATHGTMVTYGAMSRRSLKVPNKFLIFKDLSLRGLWVSRWIEAASQAEIRDVLRPLAAMMVDGTLDFAIDEVVPMKDFRHALERAQAGGRSGKVILDLTAG